MKNKRILSVALDRKASGTNNCLYKCTHTQTQNTKQKETQTNERLSNKYLRG